MKIIGLTGGIGSGKSTVLKMFEELGVKAYIADIEAKKLMKNDVELVSQIKNLFEDSSYSNGELNRAFIASIVFNDKEKLSALNNLVHPKVKEHFTNFIANSFADFIMYESAILFESGTDKMCDFIITVTADFNDKIKRIIKRDNVSKKQILERMNNQLNDDFKIKEADFVIVNSDLKSTEQQVKTIYNLVVDFNS
ncbi:dephospho-CoA kinase [Lutibacter sp. B1]|uniref:dephospho-CoA kinase n=1 Tax=Lutibacter sp. B1 TaxID=2725996 RepID=UPI001456A22F|nr:dephospho-CoA kinase [Lutibacter sp. B1]NLP56988.1 dephospho-CoA kinase [Lutibacter sp. B1]